MFLSRTLVETEMSGNPKDNSENEIFISQFSGSKSFSWCHVEGSVSFPKSPELKYEVFFFGGGDIPIGPKKPRKNSSHTK